MHDELLAAMRAAPDDEGPRLVYADWLSSRGDPRGELVLLDHLDRHGQLEGIPQIDRLLLLAAKHGFPCLPDDPCARILPFAGGGSYPTQYDLCHGGHSYYLRWRYGFSIAVDDETVIECDLDTLTTNEWTFRETNVILAIVSDAILGDRPLAELSFPDQAGIRAHPAYLVGRSPFYGFPESFVRAHGPPAETWRLGVRDFGRWHGLWDGRRRALGDTTPSFARQSCACGVDGLSCGVAECGA